MNALLTGASGMLGNYLLPLLKESFMVMTLQRHDADFICDLSKEQPDFEEKRFDLVVHAAGTTQERDAIAVNLDGTENLLKALSANPPAYFVYVSSWEVYSPDAGENVGEDHPTWAAGKTGQSKALAEKMVSDWCLGHDVTLTIVRPSRMFGKGIKGEMARLFSDVVNARYIHVRGNEARLSLVCAIDAARAIAEVYRIGGTYNISDGKGAKWIELADAMSANSGMMKRQIFLPEKWAEVARRFTPWIPAVKESLNGETLSKRSKTLTLSNKKLLEALPGFTFYPALEVISRTNKDYPYND